MRCGGCSEIRKDWQRGENGWRLLFFLPPLEGYGETPMVDLNSLKLLSSHDSSPFVLVGQCKCRK